MGGSKPIAVALLIALLPGCVERKILVRSEPPGGVVLLDNKVVGVTPMTADFSFYGTRKVEVRWDPFLPPEVPPFVTAAETRCLYPPWYQLFPLDLVFEYVWPFTITDERVFDFQLALRGEVDAARADEQLEQVLKRAEATRLEALSEDEETP
ncbi:MAG: hypothetical protein JXQ29_06550 [Planctomycetes bacterium]|nr:hypothetical protein [Planctomycetota bacterium]